MPVVKLCCHAFQRDISAQQVNMSSTWFVLRKAAIWRIKLCRWHNRLRCLVDPRVLLHDVLQVYHFICNFTPDLRQYS